MKNGGKLYFFVMTIRIVNADVNFNRMTLANYRNLSTSGVQPASKQLASCSHLMVNRLLNRCGDLHEKRPNLREVRIRRRKKTKEEKSGPTCRPNAVAVGSRTVRNLRPIP